MANLTESPIYETGIFQLEKSTPPLGGAPVIDNGIPSAGHANAQGLQLANRTAWLKQQIENAGSATSLAADLTNSSDPSKGATMVGYDGQTVSSVLSNAKSLPNYAALRSYAGTASTINIIDDFRSGRFRKVSTTPTGYVDDGGITIITNNGSVWQRINVGETHVDWFLAPGWVEGVTDDKVAFERASQFLRARGGGRVRFFRRHLLDTTTFINDLVHLQGPIPSVGRIMNGVKDYGKRQGVLIINPAVSIYMESSAKLSNAILMRKGLGPTPFADNATAVAEVAKFAGTAVISAAHDSQLDECLFLGFDKAFYSSGQARVKIRNVMGDCNSGIHIDQTFDVFDVSNCHFWPFLTTEWEQSTSRRSGIGYRVTNSDDWGRLNRCFAFGYEKSFSIESSDSITCFECAADIFGGITNTSTVGFDWSGTSKAGMMIGCQAASQWRGVQINITPTDRPNVQIIGGQFWNNDNIDVKIINGYGIISNNFFSRAPIGVSIDATALGAIITSNRFDLCSTRPVDGTMTNVAADNNQFINCVDTVMGNRKLNSGTSLTNRYDTVYGASPISNLYRRAGGLSSAPTALPDGQTIASLQGQAHNGTDFRTLAGIRFQTSGAQSTTSAPGVIVFSNTPANSITGVDNWVMDQDRSFRPVGDAVQNIARAANRVNNLFLAVAPTVGSDARYKTAPKDITDKVLDAWATVDYKSYQLLDAVAEKGKKNARRHFGVIAQQVVEAFKLQGLDATDYGLLCHDSWEASAEVPEQLDAEGNILVHKQEAIEAADRYSIRYEEALVLESALMRRTQQRLEARLKALEDK